MRVLAAILAVISFLSAVIIIAYLVMPSAANTHEISGSMTSSNVTAINKALADKKYFGVVTEIDKGEGVFALEWNGYVHSESEWAGMIAEFKRRHPDLEVLSHSVMVNTHWSYANGVVINTTPKNRCPQ